MPRTPAIAKLILLASSAPATAPAATIATLDSGQISGSPSLAIGVDGLPVVAYATPTLKLRVAKCQQWDCASVVVTEIPGNYFGSSSLALAIAPDGNPAIAFQDASSYQLMLVKCATADCTGGGHEFRTIDPGPGLVGWAVDFAFAPDGRAAFAYRDPNGTWLARCSTPGCGATDIQMLTVNIADDFDKAIALNFGGRNEPVVAAHWSLPGSSEAVVFFDCSIQPCSGSRVDIDLVVGQQRGQGVSMAISPTDNPVIAYKDEDANTLELSRCLTPDCDGLVLSATLDQGALGIGPYTAVAVRPDNRPVVAFQKNLPVAGGAAALYVAECDSVNCASVSRIALDNPGAGGETGADPEIALDAQGAVVVAYFHPASQSIKLARCNAETCEGPGDRLFRNGFQ